MKTYPSIPKHYDFVGEPVWAFDKIDGSNIRTEWSKKKGFWKFGSRKRLLGTDQDILAQAEPTFIEQHGEELERIFVDNRWREKVTVISEFHGPSSSFGQHVRGEKFRCTIIDIWIHKKGQLPPRDLVKLFENTDIDVAPLLYRGPLSAEFIEQVRAGELPGVTFEGVVCKGRQVSPGRRLMCKVKSQAWLDQLRSFCGDDENLFAKLA